MHYKKYLEIHYMDKVFFLVLRDESCIIHLCRKWYDPLSSIIFNKYKCDAIRSEWYFRYQIFLANTVIDFCMLIYLRIIVLNWNTLIFIRIVVFYWPKNQINSLHKYVLDLYFVTSLSMRAIYEWWPTFALQKKHR